MKLLFYIYINIYTHIARKTYFSVIILLPRKNFNQDFINYIVTVQCDILIGRDLTVRRIYSSVWINQEHIIYVSTPDWIIFPSSHRALELKLIVTSQIISILVVSNIFVQRLFVMVKILGAVELLEVWTSVIAMSGHCDVHLMFKKPNFSDLVLVVYVMQILLVFLLRWWEEVMLKESFNWMLKHIRNEDRYIFR